MKGLEVQVQLPGGGAGTLDVILRGLDFITCLMSAQAVLATCHRGGGFNRLVLSAVLEPEV